MALYQQEDDESEQDDKIKQLSQEMEDVQISTTSKVKKNQDKENLDMNEGVGFIEKRSKSKYD